MSEQRLLRLIEEEMAALSASALEQPAARDAFEYGRVVGLRLGLRRAFEIVANAFAEEEAEGKDL